MPSRSVTRSLQEYGRGIAGGLIFSLPLLFTMEMWWAGFTMPADRQLAYVCATFLLLLGYNRFAGLRPDSTWYEVAIDSVEEMGLGLALAALILLALGRIGLQSSPAEILGKTIVEGMTVAIGVSVGTAQLGGNDDNEEHTSGTLESRRPGFGGQLTLAICGAVLFAANIAPTEEIQMLAAGISSYHLVGLVLLSMAIGTLVLFFSDFSGAARVVPSPPRRGDIVEGAVITYAAALAASAAILWAFGRFDGRDLHDILAQTLVLGFAATLGASAGRLLLQ